MQGLAFRGHEEAENLSPNCGVNRDNYRAKDLPQVKLKIDSPVSSFGHGKKQRSKIHKSGEDRLEPLSISSQ